MKAITILEETGFTVVAIVRDLGPCNQRIHTELNLTSGNPYFGHPSTPHLKIFVFADIPYMLKLVRNHLLDNSFKLMDGTIINKKPLEKLLEIQLSDLKPGWILTKQILDVNSNERQNVAIATKLLSWNTSKALLLAGNRKLLGDISYKPLSILIELINEWFDIHNSKAQYGVHQGIWYKS